MLKRKNAPEAWQGNEGATEIHYYEGTIPMTVMKRTVSRILRLLVTVALTVKVGHNIRTAAREKGFTRSTLQAATGETWLNTQRAWFGVSPLARTVLMTQLAMRVDARQIWPATPKGWA